jgi:hypothetical protein
LISVPAPIRRRVEDDRDSVLREQLADVDHLTVKGFPFLLIVVRPNG